MRAARFDGALSVESVPVPSPGPGEVLVEVHAVGVNQLERQVMAGALLGRPSLLPRTVGLDPVGVIVSGERAGERVAVKPNLPCGACGFCTAGHEADCGDQRVVGVHRDGGAADYVVVPSSAAFPIGDIPFAQAAAAVHSVPIALHMVRRAGISDTVLVTGAAGALGCAAVQVASALGAQVIAGALEGEPVEDLHKLGADEVVTYPRTGDGLEEAVKPYRPGLVLDCTGSGTMIDIALRSVRWAGSVVVAAALPESSFTVDTRAFYTRRITLYGCAAADFADVRDGLRLVAEGRVRPPVAASFPLEQIEEAFAMAGRRDHLGKVVLAVREEASCR